MLFAGDPVGHFTGGFVGERKQQDAARIDALVQKTIDPGDKGLRLTGSRPGLKQIGLATMRRGRGLERIRRSLP